MDYINYSDKVHAGFPTVSASPSSPATLYHAPSDIVYVNTGSGWQPLVHLTSGSVYSAYSTAAPSTQTAILASVTNTSSAPSSVHKIVATAASTIAVRGR